MLLSSLFLSHHKDRGRQTHDKQVLRAVIGPVSLPSLPPLPTLLKFRPSWTCPKEFSIVTSFVRGKKEAAVGPLIYSEEDAVDLSEGLSMAVCCPASLSSECIASLLQVSCNFRNLNCTAVSV